MLVVYSRWFPSDGTASGSSDSPATDERGRRRGQASTTGAPSSSSSIRRLAAAGDMGLAAMIIPVLLVAVLCCPGCGRAALVRFHEHGSAERIPAEKDAASHGPQIDTDEFPGDPYGAYPGLGFGPMGPIPRSVNEATLRSLSSASDAAQRPEGSQQLAAPSDASSLDQGVEQSPKPEYHIVSVEFTRVETPFVIGIWIFFASLAKIGKCRRAPRGRRARFIFLFSSDDMIGKRYV